VINGAWFIAGVLIATAILIGLDALVAEPVIPETVLNVDGVQCWFENFPVLNYRVADQAVDVLITCTTDIIDHHLPAIERTQ
tara:strand:+ start:450 stop:695 length:246 start_codon:yes stop_codon:yes gene_type:complete